MITANESDSVNSTMNEILIWRRQVYKVISPALMLLCLVAFLCNSLVMWVFARRFRLGALKPTLQLAFSLTASDTWTSLLVCASLVYNSYLPIVLGMRSNACASLTMEVFRTGGLLTCLLHLLATAVHHTASVYWPVKYQQQLRNRRTCSTLAAFATLWLLPPLLVAAYASVKPDHGYRSVGCKELKVLRSLPFRWSISGVILVIFAVICTLYALLLCHMGRQRRRFQPTLRQQRNVKREHSLLKTTSLICGTFFIGWLPACLQYSLTCEQCPYPPYPPGYELDENFKGVLAISTTILMLIIIKSIVNPVVYTTRIPEIKMEVMAMMATFYRVKQKSTNYTAVASQI